MKKIWDKISYLGIDSRQKNYSNLNIILANRLNFMMFVLLVFLNLATTILREIYQGPYTIHTKKLLIMLVINIMAFGFSYYRFHKVTKTILVFFPSLVLVFLPLLFGFIDKMDYFILPLVIIGLSTVPQLILKPALANKFYITSLLYFFIQVLFLETILTKFSNNISDLSHSIAGYSAYFNIAFIAVFLFIQSTIYYLVNLNYKYKTELQDYNEDLKSTIEKLKDTQQQLIQSEKMASLGILAAGIAHEINNPLNFIQGGLYGLSKYLDVELEERKSELMPLLNGIDEGVRRASNIVSSLNQYSRNYISNAEICNIHNIIDNCLIILKTQLITKVEIEKDYTKLNYNLLGNEGHLHQVMLNILTNSVQAIKDKGNIKISTKTDDQNLIISIIDSGFGIQSENLSKIFDPFFTTKEPGQGTGLGMSISLRIIKEHKGKITYKSEIDKGTEVIVILPLNI